ncbi:MAG: ATPase, T2SS/T4P/T4SS family, partial [Pseudomonadota bacterium]
MFGRRADPIDDPFKQDTRPSEVAPPPTSFDPSDIDDPPDIDDPLTALSQSPEHPVQPETGPNGAILTEAQPATPIAPGADDPPDLNTALEAGAIGMPGLAPGGSGAQAGGQITAQTKAQTTAPQSAPKPAPKPANDRPPASRGSGDFQPSRAPDLSERYIAARDIVFEDIRQGVDVTSLVRLDRERARQDIETAVETIINFRRLDLTASEQFSLSREVCDDILGYGPLEPLLARDDIADIMVNGPETVYIETEGKISQAPIRFRDNQHLINICQKIVSAVGRRIDESSPICDARLPDGSRVNAIIPPLAVDGATLTIRKFKQEKLTLEKLMEYGSVDQATATVLRVASACRCNILISGGTGSGKTTMLNCLTGYISPGERVITCE